MSCRPRAVRTAVSSAALLLAFLPAPPLAAQADGTPIRIQTIAKPGKWVTGGAFGITADSVGITRRAGNVVTRTWDTLRYARTELHRMAVSRGRKSNAKRGAVGGAALGFLVGLAVAAGSDESMVEFGGGAVAGLTLGLGALGAGLGALSGHEIWEEVPVNVPDPTTAGGGPAPAPGP